MSVNPIIPGFAPDPSLVLVDGNYYLVNSTFHLYPGLPIYVSKDLVHWNHIGNAINRPEQLRLTKSSTIINRFGDGDSLLATGGLYAPTIRYRDGTFYIVCTNVIHQNNDRKQNELQNFIISTTDIYSSAWSDPVYFDFYGIDPSLSWNTDGRAYICGSKQPGPDTKITLFEMNLATGQKLSEEKDIWTGTGGIYPEGPHIYFLNDLYYVVIAEGGTHEGHSVRMARSKNIFGPYEASPANPVLTASGTDEYVQCTGHCELFQDTDGEWWGVCLGIRMGAEKLYGLGRETFLTKALWRKDGWLSFERVKTGLAIPGVKAKENERLTAALGADYLYIRDPDVSRYDISSTYETIKLQASPIDVTHPEASPTFIGKRQRHLDGASSVTLVKPDSSVSAGLVLYKDEHRILRIFYTSQGAASTQTITFEVVNVAQSIKRSEVHQLDAPFSAVRFTISYTEMEYKALFSVDGQEPKELGRAATAELSGKDFVGPVVGIYVTGETGEAEFEKFVVDSSSA